MAKAPSAQVVAAAQAAQRKYGIPAPVSIAQYALESGWGSAMPPGSNNPFGMKVRSGKNDPYVETRTREVLHGKTTIVTAKFRKFASLEEAFEEHAKLLATAPVYAAARKVMNSADQFADALTGVYATDPAYGSLLKQVMRGANLYAFGVKA